MRTHEPAAGLQLAHGVGVSRAAGTFGELLQGVLADEGLDFLVTLPIELWSTARFHVLPTTDTLSVSPAGKQKSLALAGAMLRALGLRCGGRLTIESDIPEGKGFASSSADLVATCRAIGSALGKPVPEHAIEDLLRLIEPSDGVMYSGVVAFYHRQVRLRARLGQLPGLTIVGIDEGGTVSTIAFNRIPKPFDLADRREYGRLLDRLTRAIGDEDLETIGEVATRSALLNQKLRPKRTLPDMLAVCQESGGLGVVTAHSGTLVGVLLADDDPAHSEKLDRAVRGCRRLAGHAVVYRSLYEANERSLASSTMSQGGV